MKIANKLFISKVFLITYSICFLFIFFTQDSEIPILQPKISKIIYFIMLSIGIIVNIALTVYSGIFYKKYDLLLLLILLFLFIIPQILFHSKVISPILLLIYLLILNAKYIEPYRFIKIDFIIRLIVCVSILLLALLRIFPPLASYEIRNGFIRYNLGFLNSNALGIFILSIFVSYILLNYTKNDNCCAILIMTIVYIIISFVSESRNFQISGFVLLLLYFCNYSKYFKKVIKILTIPIIILSLLFGISFALNPDLNSKFFVALNNDTSGRIAIQAQILANYPVKFLGYISSPYIDTVGLAHNFSIDNFYMALLIHCGILGLIIFIIILIRCGLFLSSHFGCSLISVVLIVMIISLITIYSNDMYAPLIFIFSLINFRKHNNYSSVKYRKRVKV